MKPVFPIYRVNIYVLPKAAAHSLRHWAKIIFLWIMKYAIGKHAGMHSLAHSSLDPPSQMCAVAIPDGVICGHNIN